MVWRQCTMQIEIFSDQIVAMHLFSVNWKNCISDDANNNNRILLVFSMGIQKLNVYFEIISCICSENLKICIYWTVFPILLRLYCSIVAFEQWTQLQEEKTITISMQYVCAADIYRFSIIHTQCAWWVHKAHIRWMTYEQYEHNEKNAEQLNDN